MKTEHVELTQHVTLTLKAAFDVPIPEGRVNCDPFTPVGEQVELFLEHLSHRLDKIVLELGSSSRFADETEVPIFAIWRLGKHQVLCSDANENRSCDYEAPKKKQGVEDSPF
jgi:hypothetical protein